MAFYIFSVSMENNQITKEMKRHAVIFAIHAKPSEFEIVRSLEDIWSFVHKVRKDFEASSGDVSTVAKCRIHS